MDIDINDISDHQRILLEKFLSVLERVPPSSTPTPGTTAGEEPSWKNCWNWNLCDAAYGCLILDIKEGRVSSELKSQGFNYAYRRTVTSATTTATTATNATATTPQTNVPALPATSPANKQTHLEPKTPASEATSSPVASKEKDAHTNGHVSADKAEQKKKDRKEKEKEKRERQRADREKDKHSEKNADGAEQPSTGPKVQSPKGSGKVTPIPPAPSSSATPPPSSEPPAADGHAAKPFTNDADPTSPVNASGTESTGNRTPTSRRPPRHPWTLFMKLPAPVSDQELRDFFQDAKEGITKVNMPTTFYGRGRVAYVEFGDEEAMKEGLVKHAEVIF